MAKKRVCVIGAGVSGLPAIKACLEEGLDVVCYERTTQIGGLWNYRPNAPDIGATVMGSTVVNTSKEMMAYSDFPPPSDWPNFMHHSYVHKYVQDQHDRGGKVQYLSIQLYAAHFGLIKHIQFNTEVKKLELVGDLWVAHLCDGRKEQFDAAMLCTGHHSQPSIPALPGLGNFKGRVLHAKEYRDCRGFEGKRVFLLGIGNSALDIAVDLAKIAKSVVLSTRRGSWIFNRVIQQGMPYDVVYQSRFYRCLMDTLPWSIANDFHEYRIQQRLDHDLYGLRPTHRFFQQHPAVNDALANLLASGQIVIANDISQIGADCIHVEDGRQFEADALILCTGYSFGFPFLSPSHLVTVSDKNEVDLFKFVFPPSHSPGQRLAIIGLVQPIGSVAPISEMQSRWAAAVFSGRLSLPSELEMRADIARSRAQMRRQYFESAKHTLQVQFIPYMDELAQVVGCAPDIRKYIWSETRLALSLFFGPNVPYVYRLSGKNAWSGARSAIENVPIRVKTPMAQRGQIGRLGSQPRAKKGILDGWFRYSTTKCIALYLFVAFSVGAWTFARIDADFPSSVALFALYNVCICFVTFLFCVFQFDFVWL